MDATDHGEPSVRELIEDVIVRAEENQNLGAFWAIGHDRALRVAAALDRKPSAAKQRPLHGIPVAVKDLFDVAGLPTTGGLVGSSQLARVDAEAVRRLTSAGAVPVGKTAMDQLGCTTGGQAPGFAPCINPLDPTLSPGGSSSGSAVAVAAGIVPLALGSDTAGSVRIPAAYCSIVGCKPPLQRLPRRGAMPVMGAWEVPGLLARSVEECARGYVALSARSLPMAPAEPLRVAALDDLIEASEDPVGSACESALGRLDSDRFHVERTVLDWDGQGFGIVLRRELAASWGERVRREPHRFSETIQEMIERDSKRPERYAAALARIGRARRRLSRRLRSFDVVVCPTIPVPAPRREHEAVTISTRFTRIFSALGWPALCLPCGVDAEDRPISVHISALPSRFDRILSVARALERAISGSGVIHEGAGRVEG